MIEFKCKDSLNAIFPLVKGNLGSIIVTFRAYVS